MRAVLVVLLLVVMASAGMAGKPFNVRLLEDGADPVYELSGDIQPESAAMVFAVIGSRRGGTLFLDSQGGDLDASIAIGRLARRQHITTYVRHDAACLSGCAIIWAGGFERWDEGGLNLGFHRPWDVKTGADADQYSLRVYFRRMGYSPAAIEKFMWPSTSFYWLNADRADKLGIRAVFTE